MSTQHTIRDTAEGKTLHAKGTVFSHAQQRAENKVAWHPDRAKQKDGYVQMRHDALILMVPLSRTSTHMRVHTGAGKAGRRLGRKK